MTNLKCYSGFVIDVNYDENILYFVLNEDDVETDYESSFDIVLEEHKKFIKSGVYIQYIENQDSGVAFIIVEELKLRSEKYINNIDYEVSALFDNLKWN